MNFLIADTFTDSLARLTGNEQQAVPLGGSTKPASEFLDDLTG